MLRIRVGLLGLLLSSACTIPNENHCGNHDGDQTCAEGYGDAIHCSTCVADNDGCVAEMPSDVCRFVPQDSDETGSEVTTATLTGTPMNPSTTASSASASGGSTSSDSMTTSPVTASSTSSDPTTDSETSTTSEDPTTTTDPTDDDSTTTDGSTDPTDVSTTTSPTTGPDETTDDPSMTTADPTGASTGEDCVSLGSPCNKGDDCCLGLCLEGISGDLFCLL
jgi:hypothetical protein